ncbi:MAG: hypothetical protein JXB00_14945 [Bacteroidales bacterium]|nr:hypothetical protein [Bacteroidales bacterium]
MEKISTKHSLDNSILNNQKDELASFVSLLNDENFNLAEVNNYLDSLKKDVSGNSVQKIIEFARRYRENIKNEENAVIR